MWHGYKIAVTVLSANLPAGVDTAEDLERVRRLWPAAYNALSVKTAARDERPFLLRASYG